MLDYSRSSSRDVSPALEHARSSRLVTPTSDLESTKQVSLCSDEEVSLTSSYASISVQSEEESSLEVSLITESSNEEVSSSSDASLAVSVFLQSHSHKKPPRKPPRKKLRDCIGYELTKPPSNEELVASYSSWKKEIKSAKELESLSRSKREKWLMKYTYQNGRKWKICFPWMEFIQVDGAVVGIVCSLCRNMSPEQFKSTWPRNT